MKKLVIFLLFPVMAFAQKIPDFGISKVRIIETDKTILAEIKSVSNHIITKNDKLYYWYGSNGIHTTQGGYSGKLLNGSYTEYYVDKSLKQQGEFKEGLKYGLWKIWNEKGVLLNAYNWKKGTLSGDFSTYDDTGILKQTGTYRDGVLDGSLVTYAGKDSVNKVMYDRGKLVSEPGTTIWQKLHLAKKKEDLPVKQNQPLAQPAKPKPNDTKPNH